MGMAAGKKYLAVSKQSLLLSTIHNISHDNEQTSFIDWVRTWKTYRANAFKVYPTFYIFLFVALIHLKPENQPAKRV